MPAARLSLPPKLKVTFVPGCFSSNRRPKVVKLSSREAAAKTVTVPETFDDEDAEESEPGPVEEQALTASSAAADAPAT
ncbi:hypothetical protein GCM10027074_68780 [Streptomyces deserti]